MENKNPSSRPVAPSMVCSTDLNNSSLASGSVATKNETGSISRSDRSSSDASSTMDECAVEDRLQSRLITRALFSRRAIFGLLAGGLMALLLWTSLSYFVMRESELARIDSQYADLISLANATDNESLETSMDRMLSTGEALAFPLKGYVIYSNGYGSEPLSKGGDTEALGRIPVTNPASSRYFTLSDFYDTSVAVTAPQNTRSYSNTENLRNTSSSVVANKRVIHLRVDTQRVASNLQAYLIRTTLLSVLGVVLAVMLFAMILSSYFRRAIVDRLKSDQQQNDSQGSPTLAAAKSEHAVLTSILEILEQSGTPRQDPPADSADLLASERLSHFAAIGEHLLWESDQQLRLTHVAGDEKLLGSDGLEGQSRNRHALEAALAAKGVEKHTFRQVVDSLHVSKHWQGKLVSGAGEDVRTYRVAGEKIPDGSLASGFRGFLIDTTEDSAAREQLQQEARLDDLTGVANRRGFLTDVQNALDNSVKTGARHSICMLDLDRFKQVNDTCGHAAGDMLLVHIADILRHEVRASDIVARLGGDEFALLMENCPVERAAEVAESARQKIDDYRFNWNGQSHSVGISIGVVEISDEFSNAKSIVVAADACCYRAKRSGRNQVQLHSADDELLLAQQAEVDASNRIVDALDENRIELVCQPVVNFNSRSKSGSASGSSDQLLYEVTSELRESDGSYSPESEFMPDAERFNLIAQVDLYIFNHALIWFAGQLEEQGDWVSPEHIQISVNVSGLSLQDPVYQQGLLNLLESSPIDNSFICIEISEAFLSKKLETVYSFLQKLGEHGCKLILDKLTNGVSVLAAVSELPVSHAKLDRNMTSGISSDPLKKMLLRTVGDIADHFDIQLIALGIDEASQWDALTGQRIASVQGAFVGESESLDKTGKSVSDGLLVLKNHRDRAA